MGCKNFTFLVLFSLFTHTAFADDAETKAPRKLERGLMLRAAMNPGGSSPEGTLSDRLVMENLLREAQDDVLTSRQALGVFEGDIVYRRTLFEMDNQLFSQRAISESDFRISRSILGKARARAAMAKAELNDKTKEAALWSLRLEANKGAPPDPAKLAQIYADIWEARHERAEAEILYDQADLDYQEFAYNMSRTLLAQKAESRANFIVTEARTLAVRGALKLHQEREQEMKKFWQDALDAAKDLEHPRKDNAVKTSSARM